MRRFLVAIIALVIVFTLSACETTESDVLLEKNDDEISTPLDDDPVDSEGDDPVDGEDDAPFDEEDDQTGEFTIRLETDGGDLIEYFELDLGDTITLPELQSEDSDFYAWYDGTQVLSGEIAVEGDLSLTAMWHNDISDFQFEIMDEEVTLEYYFGSDATVVVPSTYSDLPVTKIGPNSFKDSNVYNVFIPNSIESIGNSAFQHADRLSKVVFENDSILTTIGEYAFDDLMALRSLNLEVCTLLDRIQRNAFSEIENLDYLVIPLSVSYIGTQAFYESDMSLLFEHESAGANWSSYWGTSSPSNIIFNYRIQGQTDELKYIETKDSEIIITGLVNNASTLYLVIPETINSIPVTTIGKNAFEDTDLKKVTLPSTVTLINSLAFYNSDQITEIILAEGSQLNVIGLKAFSDMDRLTTVNLEASSTLETIEFQAFSHCTSLDTLIIPISVTFIGSYAFGGSDNVLLKIEADSAHPNWSTSWALSGVDRIIWGYNLQ